MKSNYSYWQLVPYIRSQAATLTIAFVCTLVFTTFWPILASLAGNMAKHISHGDVTAILSLAGVVILVFLLRGASQYGQDSLIAKVALKIVLELRKKVYAHLQTLDINYFEMTKTGDLSYRLTEDIERIGEVIKKFFQEFVPSILQLIFVFGYMFYINWRLTIIGIIIAPVMGLLVTIFGEVLFKYSRLSQTQISNLSSLLIEVFSGVRLIKAFAAEDFEYQLFAKEAEKNRRIQYQEENFKAFQYVVVVFLQAMSIMFLFFLAGWQISRKHLTGIDFISYLTAVVMLIDPIARITNNYNQFKQGQASIERIFELLDIEPIIRENNQAIVLQSISGKVEYRQVNFAYSRGQLVLKNINFIAYPGEMIALVGHSGAGKTSLVNLLLRFYDPIQGKILIDDVNIQDVTLNSLRQQIGVVLQENILFSGTVAQNIAFGEADLNLKKIEEAAKVANAHQFISELSQGYSTYVGERGIHLSGGQRQRIAIARAVFSNPRILILDEATSALDSESENLVQEALERIMKDRTVFVIAHRLATIRRANRIFILEQGQITESGNHTELLAYNGRYAHFYAQQFK